LRWFVLLPLLCAPLAGVDQPVVNAPRVTLLPWSLAMPADLQVGQGASARPLTLSPMAASAPLLLGTNRALRLFVPAREPGQPDLPVLEVRLPDTLNEALVVFSPEAAGTRHLIFDTSPQTFPAGSLRLVNLSSHPAAVRIGETVYELAPGAEQVRPLPEPTPPRLGLLVTLNLETGWTEPALTTVNLPRAARATCFIGSSDQAVFDDGGLTNASPRTMPRVVVSVDRPVSATP